ncbi:MAG TPA: glycosyltransferase family 4 protein [Geminicoccus sp.]|jgi:glycosyltransferase involved in cell wall biosynthesis|uniref:glycosyltransferase family 4 protein n=1 Tax=Geminicoccus sp. TaxID=2024832 RepID=UPI002E379D54|nr:glycosyltransferase family 4 protein [Geminicoccus sp.]HEX2526052.1 glycosyltransferase family 4 protein [Geminicoccus sp.]
MRICLISTEIFAWGKHGGFGRATRMIGGELVKRGVEVFAVVPQRPGQQAVEKLDGITVLGFHGHEIKRLHQLFKEVDADIYHSCEISLGTLFAQWAMPHRRHMITFRDPRNFTDWVLEFARPSLSRLQVVGNYVFESSPPLRRAVRNADALYTIAHWLVPKVEDMYRPCPKPRFLPTPVPIPPEPVKAEQPTVCYVARLDRRKRPHLFFDLAPKFPHVRFKIMGKSRDKAYETWLRDTYGKLPNVEFLGMVDQFASDTHGKTLGESWIMVNTATREAMPNSFLEAASYGCAIMSYVDPDDFASKFGYHAAKDDFTEGLAWLLENNRWRERGALARQHVTEVFRVERAMDLHMEAYGALLSNGPARRRGVKDASVPEARAT